MASETVASSRKRPLDPRPLTPEQTVAWVRTYGRHARLHAWGFFALVLPLIFGLIWWELGEVNEDVLASFGFAALVFFLLARWSLAAATQGWTAVVEDMHLREVRGGQANDISRRPVAVVRTCGGKVLTLRLTEALYGYFNPGDRIFKISGLDWPEKAEAGSEDRICLACGELYARGVGRCPRCGAPEPDHDTLVRMAG